MAVQFLSSKGGIYQTGTAAIRQAEEDQRLKELEAERARLDALRSKPVITWSGRGYGSGTYRTLYKDGQPFGTIQIPRSFEGRDEEYMQSQFMEYATPSQTTNAIAAERRLAAQQVKDEAARKAQARRDEQASLLSGFMGRVATGEVRGSQEAIEKVKNAGYETKGAILAEAFTPEEQAGAKRMLESSSAKFDSGESLQRLYDTASFNDSSIKPVKHEITPFEPSKVSTDEIIEHPATNPLTGNYGSLNDDLIANDADIRFVPGIGIMKKQKDEIGEGLFQEAKSADIKPADWTYDFYDKARGVANDIRAWSPDAPQEIKDSFGWKLGSYGKESSARLVEMAGMTPLTLDVMQQTARKNPELLVEVVAYGAVKTGEGLTQEAQKNPAQVASDLIITGAIIKGAGKAGKIAKETGSAIKTGTEKTLFTSKGEALGRPADINLDLIEAKNSIIKGIKTTEEPVYVEVKPPSHISTPQWAIYAPLETPISKAGVKTTISNILNSKTDVYTPINPQTAAGGVFALSSQPAGAIPTENQLKTYELIKDKDTPDIIKIEQPHSPVKVITNLKGPDAIKTNKKFADDLTAAGMEDIGLDRRGNVVKKHVDKSGNFNPQATDEILIEMEYFNKGKAERALKHRKNINLGDEEPGIYTQVEPPKRGYTFTRAPYMGRSDIIDPYRSKHIIDLSRSPRYVEFSSEAEAARALTGGIKGFDEIMAAGARKVRRAKTELQLIERPKAETDAPLEVLDLRELDKHARLYTDQTYKKFTREGANMEYEIPDYEGARLSDNWLSSKRKSGSDPAEAFWLGTPQKERTSIEQAAVQITTPKQRSKQRQKPATINDIIQKASVKQKQAPVQSAIQKQASIEKLIQTGKIKTDLEMGLDTPDPTRPKIPGKITRFTKTPATRQRKTKGSKGIGEDVMHWTTRNPVVEPFEGENIFRNKKRKTKRRGKR